MTLPPGSLLLRLYCRVGVKENPAVYLVGIITTKILVSWVGSNTTLAGSPLARDKREWRLDG